MRQRTVARPPSLPTAVAGEQPWLCFRAMAPSESLVALAREQDALCRGVLSVDSAATRVEIERRGAHHHVVVRAASQGVERCGSAAHVAPEIALRVAYSELLRSTALSVPCPCAAA